jgi:hypothetical protein
VLDVLCVQPAMATITTAPIAITAMSVRIT